MKIDRVIETVRSHKLNEMMTAGAAGATNNVGDGKIAGTVEAGDDPPVRKKKNKGNQLFLPEENLVRKTLEHW